MSLKTLLIVLLVFPPVVVQEAQPLGTRQLAISRVLQRFRVLELPPFLELTNLIVEGVEPVVVAIVTAYVNPVRLIDSSPSS